MKYVTEFRDGTLAAGLALGQAWVALHRLEDKES